MTSPEKARILVVEDRDSLRRLLEHALAGEGYTPTAARNLREGLSRIGREPFDCILTDLKLPDGSGLEIVRAARAARPPIPVLVMTAYGTVTSAVEAMKLGASDFLEKPVDMDDLFSLVGSLVGGKETAAAFRAPDCAPIIGRHPRLRAALHLLQRVAPTTSTVLLLGESGTGKELFARALHALSSRPKGPFVAVNCAAIPETLMENELFGHEKGAFTGADRRREGRFEHAAGGTLLLDEIGELALGVQGKVLRVLEERTFERVGGGATLRSDVRLVAATNRNLRSMVDQGSFRSDLFFRLDVFPIELPALRERSSDVPLIARHLLSEIAARHGRPAPELEPEAAELLAAQPWPGNVRELVNLLERAVILTEGSRLDVADLEPLLRPGVGGSEREHVRQALVDADGDKRRAAEILGVSYRTLLRRVREFDLDGVPKYRS